jgi:hypothetical protein
LSVDVAVVVAVAVGVGEGAALAEALAEVVGPGVRSEAGSVVDPPQAAIASASAKAVDKRTEGTTNDVERARRGLRWSRAKESMRFSSVLSVRARVRGAQQRSFHRAGIGAHRRTRRGRREA